MIPDLSPLLSDGQVHSVIRATSRKQVLCELGTRLAESVGLEGRTVIEAVMERERLGSTGVGSGVAIPHARIDGLDHTVGAFARIEPAVDFDAVDERPCDLVFMLLAPDGQGADHLRALAKVSRAMRQAAFREALREAADAAELKALLSGQWSGKQKAPNAA
jgi:nitrogen PTS system EIIA component